MMMLTITPTTATAAPARITGNTSRMNPTPALRAPTPPPTHSAPPAPVRPWLAGGGPTGRSSTTPGPATAPADCVLTTGPAACVFTSCIDPCPSPTILSGPSLPVFGVAGVLATAERVPVGDTLPGRSGLGASTRVRGGRALLPGGPPGGGVRAFVAGAHALPGTHHQRQDGADQGQGGGRHESHHGPGGDADRIGDLRYSGDLPRCLEQGRCGVAEERDRR